MEGENRRRDKDHSFQQKKTAARFSFHKYPSASIFAPQTKPTTLLWNTGLKKTPWVK
jgi:hypothetical protein